MDLDTQLVVISNLDLEAQLNKHDDRQGFDPLKALKRRLSKHEFGYLTSVSLEAQLLRRELTSETAVWTETDHDVVAERVREPITISIRDREGIQQRELAPHAIEAAALYSVVTRLDANSLPESLDLVEKAQLYDRGYVGSGEDRRDADEFDFDGDADGGNGIPVTYTRDVLADRLHADADRSHPDLPVEHVVTPGTSSTGWSRGWTPRPSSPTPSARSSRTASSPSRTTSTTSRRTTSSTRCSPRRAPTRRTWSATSTTFTRGRPTTPSRTTAARTNSRTRWR